jgi:hypothetical protein
VECLPSPLDVPPIDGKDPRKLDDDSVPPLHRKADEEEPFAALAFKIQNDPYVGQLTYFRVYSGVVKSGSYVFNANRGTRERLGRILRMHADKREEVEELMAGDIGAGVDPLGFGLCQPHPDACPGCRLRGHAALHFENRGGVGADEDVALVGAAGQRIERAVGVVSSQQCALMRRAAEGELQAGDHRCDVPADQR